MPTNTNIKVPGLPTGLTASVRVRNAATLALLETVTLTEASDIYGGDVTGAHAGRFVHEILISGTVSESRVRTIADDAGPYVIDSALEIAESFANTGSGPWAKTITIENSVGSVALENATVRLTEGADDFQVDTASAGDATFGLRSATYDIVVTKAGFTSYVGTLAVSDATGVTIQLTATGAVAVPSNPLLSTGVMVVYDELGAIEAGVPITVQMTAGPGTAGYSHDTKARTANSAATTGLVTFTGLIRGATYSIRRGPEPGAAASSFASRSSSTVGSFTVPDAASFNLSEVIGTDSE